MNKKMSITTVIEVINLLNLEYKIEEIQTNISCLKIILGYYHFDEEITKTIYFNSKNKIIIPKYEKKLKIKEQIKELQKELKKLEEN